MGIIICDYCMIFLYFYSLVVICSLTTTKQANNEQIFRQSIIIVLLLPLLSSRPPIQPQEIQTKNTFPPLSLYESSCPLRVKTHDATRSFYRYSSFYTFFYRTSNDLITPRLMIKTFTIHTIVIKTRSMLPYSCSNFLSLLFLEVMVTDTTAREPFKYAVNPT